ncbi:threonine dehydratase [Nocardia sp. GAS34]|uniref:pyridoxal-phosphate dependent enzyme n=1 Tax=unclassified Nocardia TaxID=2637762 RepID=UPI003D1B92FC
MPMIDDICWYPDVVKAWNGIVADIAAMHHTDLDVADLPNTRAARVVVAREHEQYTGSVRARGALWYLRTRRKFGELPREGIALAPASESDAAAWAWAAKTTHTPAMLVMPPSDEALLAMLRGDGVTVQVTPGREVCACRDAYARAVRALVPDPADSMFAAGVGTWVRCINQLLWNVDTVIIPGGVDGLLLGTLTAAHKYGIKTVLATPEGTAIPPAALQILTDGTDGTTFPGMKPDGRRVRLDSVTVSASDIQDAGAILRHHGLQVTQEAALALAALTSRHDSPGHCYRAEPKEIVAALMAGPPTGSSAPHPETAAREANSRNTTSEAVTISEQLRNERDTAIWRVDM